jgi:hypothetical protein
MLTQAENIQSYKAVLTKNSKLDFSQLNQIPKTEFDSTLNQFMTQIMIVEESKIVGTLKVSPSQIAKRTQLVRDQWGSSYWAEISRYFDLGESELKDRIEKNLLVELSVENRIKVATSGEKDVFKRTELGKQALEDWLTQLRSRYRVQFLKSE